MRAQLYRGAALGVVVALFTTAVATAAKPTVIRAGNLILAINGGVTPKRLPKTRLAPIGLRLAANIRTVNGAQPPAARSVTIDFDKHGAVNARGLPICRLGLLEVRTTAAARAVCRKSIVGGGKTVVRVAFPESAPFTATGPLVVFNGGVRRRVTTMYIHAYVSVPAPTALVTVVRVKKIRKGRFGTRAVARIPTIAGGAGSLTRFNLGIKRTFMRRGQRQGYLLARCANGHLFAHGSVDFADATRLAGSVFRPCIPRG